MRTDLDGNVHMIHEHIQRDVAPKRWKDNGIKLEEKGIFSDHIDKVFSIHFLLAVFSWNIPQFRPGQDCHTPKLIKNHDF